MAAASASETVNITEAWGRGCWPASDVSRVSEIERRRGLSNGLIGGLIAGMTITVGWFATKECANVLPHDC
jgi:hypothetical protein